MSAGRLTWRNEPYETGLRSIGQGPRGRIGKVDGEDVLSVSAHGGSAFGGPVRGWGWVYSDNTPARAVRSWDTEALCPTKEAAQVAATAWFKSRAALAKVQP